MFYVNELLTLFQQELVYEIVFFAFLVKVVTSLIDDQMIQETMPKIKAKIITITILIIIINRQNSSLNKEPVRNLPEKVLMIIQTVFFVGERTQYFRLIEITFCCR